MYPIRKNVDARERKTKKKNEGQPAEGGPYSVPPLVVGLACRYLSPGSLSDTTILLFGGGSRLFLRVRDGFGHHQERRHRRSRESVHALDFLDLYSVKIKPEEAFISTGSCCSEKQRYSNAYRVEPVFWTRGYFVLFNL